jgi:predicted PurR-regulated permease PerM
VKRVAWDILIITVTLIVLILLWQFRLSIVLFALSLAVSAAFQPLIRRIASLTKSKKFALGIVYSTFIGLFLIFTLLGGQLFLQDLQKAAEDFLIAYNRIITDWPLTGSVFQQNLAEQLPSSNELIQAIISEEGLVILTENGGLGQGFFSLLGYFAITIVLSIYWNADQLRFERISISLFPVEHRPKALHIWRAIESGVGAYLRSELLQSVLAGLILGVGYWLLGIRYPAFLALWVATARLIPWFGVLIAIIPLFFMIGNLPISGLLAILFTLIVLIFLRTAIAARLLKYKSNNSLLIVLFVIVLAQAFGVIGVLLAPPLATAVQILLQELYPLFARRYSNELREVFELRRRLSHILKDMKGQGYTESMKLINQLSQLIDQTITYIHKY